MICSELPLLLVVDVAVVTAAGTAVVTTGVGSAAEAGTGGGAAAVTAVAGAAACVTGAVTVAVLESSLLTCP